MNNVLTKPFDTEIQIGTENQSDSETDKYITFRLADYLFALPSQEILKIVSTPPPSQGGMVSMGLVQLEQYSIQILDLIKLLNLQAQDTAGTRKTSNKTSGKTVTSADLTVAALENPPFLMVLQNTAQKLWGIAVNEPPDLMDIPRYALKPVPAEKRLTRALRWVSHVVTYDLGGDRHTLLVLDIAVLLSPKPAEPLLPGNPSFLEIEPPLAEENASARKAEMYA
jgi:chemotaxis signal transduction protein